MRRRTETTLISKYLLFTSVRVESIRVDCLSFGVDRSLRAYLSRRYLNFVIIFQMENQKPKIDYLLEQLLQARDRLFFQIADENKDRFTETAMLCIVTMKR